MRGLLKLSRVNIFSNFCWRFNIECVCTALLESAHGYQKEDSWGARTKVKPLEIRIFLNSGMSKKGEE